MFLTNLIFLIFLDCSYSELSVKIVEGDNAEIESWPFIIFMAYFEKKEFLNLCGGSLLSSQVILTAAHCLDDVYESVNEKPESYVFMGNANLDNMTIMKNVIGYKTHEKYSVEANDYDIGLAFLDSPVDFSKTVAKTVLRNQPVRTKINAVIAGWGRTSETEEVSKNLQYITQVVRKKDYCNRKIEKLYDGAICAGNDDPTRYAYNGDSGGPLVTAKDRLQIGIVSWRHENSKNGLTVYTSVPYFFNWIRRTQEKLYKKICSRVQGK